MQCNRFGKYTCMKTNQLNCEAQAGAEKKMEEKVYIYIYEWIAST